MQLGFLEWHIQQCVTVLTVSKGMAVTTSQCHLGDGCLMMKEGGKWSGRVILTQQGIKHRMPVSCQLFSNLLMPGEKLLLLIITSCRSQKYFCTS